MPRVFASSPRAAPRERRSLRLPCAAALVLAASLAAGCAARDPNRSGLLEPYRTDLPQGNYLTQQTVDQVKEGMTREQVRFLLGTPLLRHVFHPDRWDYVFRYRFPNGNAESRKVTVQFRDDRVVSIRADELPAREDPSDPALPGYRPSAAAGKS
jgi:outer membrane protein assembly factor BamE